MERAKPPADISAVEFFTRWVPSAVAGDEMRRRRLGETNAVVAFHLAGEGGGDFTIHIREGRVSGEEGAPRASDLEVDVDIETWRMLNAGEMQAPEAVLRRRLKLSGDLLLGLKLHLILG